MIARKHLVPKQLDEHGLTARAGRDRRRRAQAGHRRLHARSGRAERSSDRSRRSSARRRAQIAEGERGGVRDRPRDACANGSARDKFPGEVAKRTADPGVATGLAWTPVGGEILFIEATAYPGGGKPQLTGQLGDVMQESAQAALLVGALACERARRRSGLVREERHPRPRAAGADAEGRARPPASRWPPRSSPSSPASPSGTRRHDRRDHSDADRCSRSAVSARRCSPLTARAQAGRPSARERGRPRRPARGDAQADDVRPRGHGRGRSRSRIRRVGRGPRHDTCRGAAGRGCVCVEGDRVRE